MASKPAPVDAPADPRLYLVTPALAAAEPFLNDLAAILDAADIAAVLLRLAPADERAMINLIKALASVTQEKNVALLIDGHFELAARSGADGAHLTGIDAFLAGVERLKPDRIAGAGGLNTRHDAMLAAERAADYVMFGEPELDGERPSIDAICERVAWWAEVFQTPCVGYAANADEIAPLARAGADFVAIGDFIFSDKAGAVPAIKAAAAQLSLEKVL